MSNFKIKHILSVVVAVLTLLLISGSLFTVDEGNVGIVKRFGEATSQYDAGLHTKVPFIDTVVPVEVRTRKNVEKLRAATHEQMPVTAEVSVNWTVNRDSALDLYKKYGSLSQFEARILDPKLRSATKDAIARFKAEELIQNRSKVIGKIEELLAVEMVDYSTVKLDSINIEDVALPAKYIQSIETKQTEKNLAAAEEHKLARQKLEAQRDVNTANAQRDAAKAKVDGNAYAVTVEAKAEAEAIRIKGDAEASAIQAKAKAIAENATLVEYMRAQRWDGKMPTTVMGDSTGVLMDLRKK